MSKIEIEKLKQLLLVFYETRRRLISGHVCKRIMNENKTIKHLPQESSIIDIEMFESEFK